MAAICTFFPRFNCAPSFVFVGLRVAFDFSGKNYPRENIVHNRWKLESNDLVHPSLRDFGNDERVCFIRLPIDFNGLLYLLTNSL